MTQLGGTCPESAVVNTLSACKDAATQLNGVSYYSEKSGTRYPAGCFHSGSVNAYFNTIVIPSQIVYPYSPYGAICHTGGT